MPISFDGSSIGQVYAGGPIKEIFFGGTLVWSSGPSWPQTGTWEGTTNSKSYLPLVSFTIPEQGIYNVSWHLTWEGSGTVVAETQIRFNGTNTRFGNDVKSLPGTSSVSATGKQLNAGDVVTFHGADGGRSAFATGGWTITKN